MFMLLPLAILLSSTTVNAGSFCLDNHYCWQSFWAYGCPITDAPTNDAICIQRYHNWSTAVDYQSCHWGGLQSRTWAHCFDYPEWLFGGISTTYEKGFMVSIRGSDRFWIDQAFFMNDNNSQSHTWGADNSQGWCLSSDTNDYEGWEKYLPTHKCCRTWYFSDNGLVYGCFDSEMFGRRLEERLEQGNLVEVPPAPKSAFKHVFGA